VACCQKILAKYKLHIRSLAGSTIDTRESSFQKRQVRNDWRARSSSAARLKPHRRRKGVLESFVERLFLAPSLIAIAIVLVRFAFRIGNHFGFSDGADQPSHPPLVNDCARSNKSRQKRLSDLQAHE